MIYYGHQIVAKEKKWEGMEPIDQRALQDKKSNAKCALCLEATVS